MEYQQFISPNKQALSAPPISSDLMKRVADYTPIAPMLPSDDNDTLLNTMKESESLASMGMHPFPAGNYEKNPLENSPKSEGLKTYYSVKPGGSTHTNYYYRGTPKTNLFDEASDGASPLVNPAASPDTRLSNSDVSPSFSPFIEEKAARQTGRSYAGRHQVEDWMEHTESVKKVGSSGSTGFYGASHDSSSLSKGAGISQYQPSKQENTMLSQRIPSSSSSSRRSARRSSVGVDYPSLLEYEDDDFKVLGTSGFGVQADMRGGGWEGQKRGEVCLLSTTFSMDSSLLPASTAFSADSTAFSAASLYPPPKSAPSNLPPSLSSAGDAPKRRFLPGWGEAIAVGRLGGGDLRVATNSPSLKAENVASKPISLSQQPLGASSVHVGAHMPTIIGYRGNVRDLHPVGERKPPEYEESNTHLSSSTESMQFYRTQKASHGRNQSSFYDASSNDTPHRLSSNKPGGSHLSSNPSRFPHLQAASSPSQSSQKHRSQLEGVLDGFSVEGLFPTSSVGTHYYGSGSAFPSHTRKKDEDADEDGSAIEDDNLKPPARHSMQPKKDLRDFFRYGIGTPEIRRREQSSAAMGDNQRDSVCANASSSFAASCVGVGVFSASSSSSSSSCSQSSSSPSMSFSPQGAAKGTQMDLVTTQHSKLGGGREEQTARAMLTHTPRVDGRGESSRSYSSLKGGSFATKSFSLKVEGVAMHPKLRDEASFNRNVVSKERSEHNTHTKPMRGMQTFGREEDESASKEMKRSEAGSRLSAAMVAGVSQEDLWVGGGLEHEKQQAGGFDKLLREGKKPTPSKASPTLSSPCSGGEAHLSSESFLVDAQRGFLKVVTPPPFNPPSSPPPGGLRGVYQSSTKLAPSLAQPPQSLASYQHHKESVKRMDAMKDVGLNYDDRPEHTVKPSHHPLPAYQPPPSQYLHPRHPPPSHHLPPHQNLLHHSPHPHHPTLQHPHHHPYNVEISKDYHYRSTTLTEEATSSSSGQPVAHHQDDQLPLIQPPSLGSVEEKADKRRRFSSLKGIYTEEPNAMEDGAEANAVMSYSDYEREGFLSPIAGFSASPLSYEFRNEREAYGAANWRSLPEGGVHVQRGTRGTYTDADTHTSNTGTFQASRDAIRHSNADLARELQTENTHLQMLPGGENRDEANHGLYAKGKEAFYYGEPPQAADMLRTPSTPPNHHVPPSNSSLLKNSDDTITPRSLRAGEEMMEGIATVGLGEGDMGFQGMRRIPIQEGGGMGEGDKMGGVAMKDNTRVFREVAVKDGVLMKEDDNEVHEQMFPGSYASSFSSMLLGAGKRWFKGRSNAFTKSGLFTREGGISASPSSSFASASMLPSGFPLPSGGGVYTPATAIEHNEVEETAGRIGEEGEFAPLDVAAPSVCTRESKEVQIYPPYEAEAPTETSFGERHAHTGVDEHKGIFATLKKIPSPSEDLQDDAEDAPSLALTSKRRQPLMESEDTHSRADDSSGLSYDEAYDLSSSETREASKALESTHVNKTIKPYLRARRRYPFLKLPSRQRKEENKSEEVHPAEAAANPWQRERETSHDFFASKSADEDAGQRSKGAFTEELSRNKTDLLGNTHFGGNFPGSNSHLISSDASETEYSHKSASSREALGWGGSLGGGLKVQSSSDISSGWKADLSTPHMKRKSSSSIRALSKPSSSSELLKTGRRENLIKSRGLQSSRNNQSSTSSAGGAVCRSMNDLPLIAPLHSLEKPESLTQKTGQIRQRNQEIGGSSTPRLAKSRMLDDLSFRYVSSEDLEDFDFSLTSKYITDLPERLKSSKSANWKDQTAALTDVRIIAKFHPQILFKGVEREFNGTLSLKAILSEVIKLFESPRSAVAKNAALCILDLFTYGHRNMDAVFDDVIPICVKKSSQTSADFISEVSYAVLTKLCHSVSPGKCLPSIMLSIKNSRHPGVKAVSLKCLAILISIVGAQILRMKDLDKLLELLLSHATGATADIRKISKIALALLQRSLSFNLGILLDKGVISAAELVMIDSYIDAVSSLNFEEILYPPPSDTLFCSSTASSATSPSFSTSHLSAACPPPERGFQGSRSRERNKSVDIRYRTHGGTTFPLR